MLIHRKKILFMLFVLLTALVLSLNLEELSVEGTMVSVENEFESDPESLSPFQVSSYTVAVKQKPPFLRTKISSERELVQAIDDGISYFRSNQEDYPTHAALYRLDEAAQKNILNNWLDPYPVAWSNLSGDLVTDELVAQLSSRIYNIEKLEWPIYRISHQFLNPIESGEFRVLWLDIVTSPSSPIEHQKQPLEWSRIYESIGFVGVERSKEGRKEICSIPVIGNSHVLNHQHILFAGPPLAEFDRSTHALSLNDQFSKRELPPEMRLGILISANVDPFCRPHTPNNRLASPNFQEISKSHFFYDVFPNYEAVLFFEPFRLRNPDPLGAHEESVLLRQQAMFHRGKWETCPLPEERSWKLFLNKEERLARGAVYYINGENRLESYLMAQMLIQQESSNTQYEFKSYRPSEKPEEKEYSPLQPLTNGELPPGPWGTMP